MATLEAYMASRHFYSVLTAVIVLIVLLMSCLFPAVQAQSLQPPRDSDETKAKLLVIELFFLFVGLLIILFLAILIWLSRRRKKAAMKK